MIHSRMSFASVLLATALWVAVSPEPAWTMPKTSRNMACKVVSLDIPRKVLLVEREAGSKRIVFEIAWTDRTLAFVGSQQSSPEGLAVGTRIHLSYVTPLFVQRRIARLLHWHDRATKGNYSNEKAKAVDS